MKRHLILLLLSFGICTSFAQTQDKRFFELRIYYCYPGRLDALINRFQTVTTKLFEKHGMENIGYWLPTNNEKSALYYVLAYPSKAAQEASWAAFRADPVWKEAAAKSEIDGKIVESITSVFMMNASDILPQINSGIKNPERIFEMRTYTANPGKVPDLTKRFKEHATKLFPLHQMESIAYFLTEEKDGAQSRLVYLLAFPSEAAATKSWAEFRADPAWIKAKADSEKDGKLTEKTESIFLKPLSFSKIR
jgi:NIPSNAP